MDERTTGFLLSRILSGYHIFNFLGKKYKLRYPNTQIKYEADLIAKDMLHAHRFEEWIRMDDVESLLYNQGLWTEHDQEFISQAEKTAENFKVNIFQNFRMPSLADKHRKSLRNHEKIWTLLQQRKHSFDYLTIESYCDSAKNRFILSRSIYDENDKLVFMDDEEGLEKISQHIDNDVISIKDFRAIGRSSLWLYYWNSQKTGNLFNASISEWTDEQRVLAGVSRMYDSARQHPEPPDDDVFEDDDAFDGWGIAEKRKDEEEKKKKKGEKMLPGNLKNASEIYVVARNREDIDNIQSLNSMESKMIKKERFTTISRTEDGTAIKEANLPDVKRDLIIKGTQQRFKKGK